MSELLLDEKIVRIAASFAEAEVPHAFGGALALAYYAVPRGTQDIDVNVFVRVSGSKPVFDLLAELGVDRPSSSERRRLEAQGQVRLYWGHTPVDLFFTYDPLHTSCLERMREVPFGSDVRIRILSAEDLAVFKVLFDRRKDWTDLAELLYAQGPDFDAAYSLDWLRRILEPDDARLHRFIEELEAD